MLILKSFTEDHDRSMCPSCISQLHFHCAHGFDTLILAHMLDSLVRVSRRAVRTISSGRINVLRSQPRLGHLPRQQSILNCVRKQQRPNGPLRYLHSTNTGPIQFPLQQFQALFNSLFKVLCIFPSRYLFAIGLSPIFSFRWNLPPTLSCTPKQLDSSNAHRTHAGSSKDGILTLHDALFQGTCSGPRLMTASIDYNSARKAQISS